MEIIYTSLAMAKLGSPMYMTGTDGVAVSTYAFDDFGRNIDPFTGKIKENNKHGYTKQGNIIQPFAFTGYQEDEVSGLKFAQARFYSAEKGRFVGEDQVGGFTESPDTQNKFIYCWNDPKKHVDRNGKFPQIIAGVLIGGAIGAVVDAVSQGVAIAKGEQESFDWGKLAGATVEGAVVGGLASTGLGACFAGSMLSGGVGALAGNVTTQLINTGTVDAEEARNATAAGIIGGAIGYGIGKVATKVAPKVLPKIASKVDDFAAKVKAFRNGGSVEAIRTEKPMFEYNLQFFAESGEGCPFEGGGRMKTGPKPKGTGPHNLKIEEIASKVNDGEIIAGGGRGYPPEAKIPTPGGVKSHRRPDILVKKADQSLYGINVGKTTAKGAPIKREVQALYDLEDAGLPMWFVSYDK